MEENQSTDDEAEEFCPQMTRMEDNQPREDEDEDEERLKRRRTKTKKDKDEEFYPQMTQMDTDKKSGSLRI